LVIFIAHLTRSSPTRTQLDTPIGCRADAKSGAFEDSCKVFIFLYIEGYCRI
jgi:hypothetical protein